MFQEEKTILTLREIADVAGISVDAARRRAKRRDRDGVWRILPSNHPQDPLRIELPLTDLDDLGRADPAAHRHQGLASATEQLSGRTEKDGEGRHGMDVQILAEAVTKLMDQMSSLTDRLFVSEQERAKARVETEAAKNEVSRLRERIEAEMASHRNALEQHQAEVCQINLSKDAEIELLRSTLADIRGRPWWRRLAG